MKSKRILLLTGGYPPETGGSDNFFHKTCGDIPHEFTILTSRYPGDRELDRQSRHSIRRSLAYTLPLIRDGRMDLLYPGFRRFRKIFAAVYDRSRMVRALVYMLVTLRTLVEVILGDFDLVICGQVLEHVEDLRSVLMRFRRQMKPTGHLLVSIPTENAVYRIGRRLAGFKGEYHHHTAAAVHSQVLNSGFEPIRRKYIPFYGPLAVSWAIDYVHTP